MTMEILLEMTDVVRDYNIELCKGINTLTRDIAKLTFFVIEQTAFPRHISCAASEKCDHAEKGLTCAMPL
jgi:hypothetical protein